MIIAREKKKNNIAEYILYMWQVEDMIRACSFDIVTIKEKIISQLEVHPEEEKEVVIWYNDLVDKMQQQGIQKAGHLDFVKDVVVELNKFHEQLLDDPEEIKYQEIYRWASGNIKVLSSKSGNQFNDIEVCLIGLYGLLTLRLKKEDISRETQEAVKTLSNLLALLSKKYKEQKVNAVS